MAKKLCKQQTDHGFKYVPCTNETENTTIPTATFKDEIVKNETTFISTDVTSLNSNNNTNFQSLHGNDSVTPFPIWGIIVILVVVVLACIAVFFGVRWYKRKRMGLSQRSDEKDSSVSIPLNPTDATDAA